jgi:D-3-phosphoglycerate dehydrogenase
MVEPKYMRPVAIYYEILKYQQKNLELLDKHFEVIRFNEPKSTSDDQLARAEVVFAPLGFVFDADFFNRSPNLKAIASNTTGIPHINVEDAQARSITICALHDDYEFLSAITPTAEHNIGLIIAATRRIHAAHAFAVSGNWDRRPWGAPKMLSRMKLGIVGYGRLGKRVAKIAQAMGMVVQYYDPYQAGGMDSLLSLAKVSDVLSINAKVTPETIKLVSRQVLEALPQNAVVINTARGEILDEDALIDELENGHLWAAALDTIDGEFSEDFSASFKCSRILNYAKNHSNLLLTPHIGGSTLDAWYETERRVIEKLISLFGVQEK